MGPLQSPKLSTFLFLFLFLFPILGSTSDELTNFVYKGCSNQKFQDTTGIYSQTLNTLFNNLVSQSTSTKYYKSTSTGTSSQSSISGLFQCRGDLSNNQCNTCIKKIPDMSQSLCGQSVAARIQLNGCYLRYEVVGFQTVGPTELLYKVCGSTQVSGAGFLDRLETALQEIAKGVVSNGYYANGYQSVYVLGQCEGGLSSGDCVNCVKTAADKVISQCGGSISGQIYLQQCYISYSYYPRGVPTKSLASSGGTRRSTQKTVAIILGGLVGVGLILACLLFTKSAFKKKKTYAKYGG